MILQMIWYDIDIGYRLAIGSMHTYVTYKVLNYINKQNQHRCMYPGTYKNYTKKL